MSILEEKQQLQEECIDADKLRFISSKISIWDFFCIPQADYLVLDKTEKSRMANEYYSKSVAQILVMVRTLFLFGNCLKKKSAFAFVSYFTFLLFDLILFYGFSGKKSSGSGEIDAVISCAVKDSTKLSMTKKVFDGRVKASITAEKKSDFNKKAKIRNF